ncbi:hypothetical protein [Phycicoccus flavus]|uniref:hypothetical protein n=1 Tax=Phycicoccus flavus TaxID=2502783 RepID=UPI000FEB62C6|nr:hypothetical protein [Phycicoccus flavus]NHA66912.1 hypothetical protein [Phycicoccus flavus]
MTAGGEGSAAPTCASCGATPSGEDALARARLTWSRAVERGRESWTCPDCSRRHLRSIEGKLDPAWW